MTYASKHTIVIQCSCILIYLFVVNSEHECFASPLENGLGRNKPHINTRLTNALTNLNSSSLNSIALNSNSKDKRNSTSIMLEKNVSQIYYNSPQIFSNPEDKRTQEEWGGNCTLAYWDRCKVIKTWFGYYVDENDPTGEVKHKELDCVLEPKYCMKNGWTVNRCHILCMSQCNKEMQYKFDKYVSHEEECKAHAHG